MHYPSRKLYVIRDCLRRNIVKLSHSSAIEKRVRCASQIRSNAETHIFPLVPLKWKMNSLPWAIFLILTGREKIGEVALCLPCFNSRQSLTSVWFLEVKLKGSALLHLAGPIALKARLGQERCSHTESTSKSNVFCSWAQLREWIHSANTFCRRCSVEMKFSVSRFAFFVIVLLPPKYYCEASWHFCMKSAGLPLCYYISQNKRENTLNNTQHSNRNTAQKAKQRKIISAI